MKLKTSLNNLRLTIFIVFYAFFVPLSYASDPLVWFDGVSIRSLPLDQTKLPVDGLIMQIEADRQQDAENFLAVQRILFRKLPLKEFYFLPNIQGSSVWELSLRLQAIPGVKLIEPNWVAPVAPR